jgi:hypothetical protein
LRHHRTGDSQGKPYSAVFPGVKRALPGLSGAAPLAQAPARKNLDWREPVSVVRLPRNAPATISEGRYLQVILRFFPYYLISISPSSVRQDRIDPLENHFITGVQAKLQIVEIAFSILQFQIAARCAGDKCYILVVGMRNVGYNRVAAPHLIYKHLFSWSVQLSKPETNEEVRVFVSYSHDDRDWCNDVVAHLKREKLEPIWDQDDIELGENWRIKLKKMLDSCPSMVVLFSENSVQKPWVLYECIYALANGKRVVFIAQPGVKIPDPISDIQGAFIELDAYFQTMQKVIDAIRHPHIIAPKQSTPSQLTKETFTVVIRRYAELAVKPDISEMNQLIRTLDESNFDEKARIQIIEAEIQENGKRLASSEAMQDTEVFKSRHRQQAAFGELLSQLLDKDALHFFKWTEPIQVDGKRIRASKYLLTRGLFFVEFAGEAVTGMDGSGGLPHVVQVDGMVRGSSLEQNLLDVTLEPLQEKMKAKLAESRIFPRDVRLPTTKEWLALAAPIQARWDRPILDGCNLISHGNETNLSVVGAYPASYSKVGCYDVIGNVWELCREQDGDWFVMGCSYRNTVLEAQRGWKTPIPVEGKALGQEVGLRFILEE